MNRRNFLMFLGVGMAAATMNPGQLIAAVSRPAQIVVPEMPLPTIVPAHAMQIAMPPLPAWLRQNPHVLTPDTMRQIPLPPNALLSGIFP